MAEFVLPEVEDVLRYHTRWNTRRLQPYEEELFDLWEENGVRCKLEYSVQGPSMTRFAVTPESRTSARKISSLTEFYKSIFHRRDIIVYPNNGRIFIDVPWQNDTVYLGDLLRASYYQGSRGLACAGGMGIHRECVFVELTDSPHLLVGGSRPAELADYLHTAVLSILMNHTPEDIEMYLCGQGRYDFSAYEPLDHCRVVSDPIRMKGVLRTLNEELGHRRAALYESRCRTIYEFSGEMPHLICVISEAAEVLSSDRSEMAETIRKIAERGPACGIHLILSSAKPAVLRPVRDWFPARISFQVSAMSDSYVLIDTKGAERLRGKGEFFYLDRYGSDPYILQSGEVSQAEIRRAVSAIAANFGTRSSSRPREMSLLEKLFSRY